MRPINGAPGLNNQNANPHQKKNNKYLQRHQKNPKQSDGIIIANCHSLASDDEPLWPQQVGLRWLQHVIINIHS